MNTEFEICGTHIAFSEIRAYRLVQREYIYRPVYKEKQDSLKKFISNSKYEYMDMLPYAAIIDENEYKHAIKQSKTNLIDDSTIKTVASGVFSSIAEAYFMKESVIKDVTSGVVSTVIDKIPFKKKQEKFHCVNISGRLFITSLDEIPAVAIRNDGRITDVGKNDDVYRLLGESISPTILTVPALLIVAKRTYMFFGNGIQLNNVDEAYNYLNQSMMYYRQENQQIDSNNNETSTGISNMVRRFLPNSGNGRNS